MRCLQASRLTTDAPEWFDLCATISYSEIPRALYVAVAEVLAFVFMLEGIDPRHPTLIPAELNRDRT